VLLVSAVPELVEDSVLAEAVLDVPAVSLVFCALRLAVAVVRRLAAADSAGSWPEAS